MIYNTNQNKLNTAGIFAKHAFLTASLKLRSYCNKHKPVGGTWKLADKIKKLIPENFKGKCC